MLSIAKYIKILAAIFAQAIIITPSFFGATNLFLESLRNIKKAVLNWSTAPYTHIVMIYHWAMITIFIIIEFCIIISIFSYYTSKPIKRNKEQLIKALHSNNALSPIHSRAELLKRVLGPNKNKENKKLINNTINQTIKPIKRFLSIRNTKDPNTLVINSKWGGGKTTQLLIAINESSDKNHEYIYESCFKYTNEMNEFFSDLFNIIDEILYKNGIHAKKETRALLENIGNNNIDIKKLASWLFKSKYSNNYLSTDIISALNGLYDKKNAIFKIIIIIDDLDRLQGKDITKVLSVLSILRKMKFVKIILPIDKDTVIEALRLKKIVNPEQFIQKYLPEQSTINISSGYQFASTIIAGHIINNHPNLKDKDVSPAVNAVAIKLLSNKMKILTNNWSYNSDIRWLSEQNGSIIKEYTGPLYSLLRTPKFINDINDQIGTDYASLGAHTTKYDWHNTASNDPRKYENIILMLKRTDGGYIREMFTNDDYNEVVDSWLFEYMTRYWNLFEFTIRDCIDYADQLSSVQLSEVPGEQFAQAYNKLFENKEIIFDSEE